MLEDMRLIYTFGSRVEAMQFISCLQGSGIEAFMRSDDEAGLLPALSFQLGVKVYVRSEDFERAIKLVNSFPI